MIKKSLLALLLLLLLIIAAGWWVGAALFFERPEPKLPTQVERGIGANVGAGDSESTDTTQILFGDLHVHSSYSLDAAIFDTSAVKGTGYTTPVDACDFARYCSALDFWSINDHAEALAPWQWQETKNAIRECNAVSDAKSPDMVSFLGWEWSHGSSKPSEHYGHKNVIFRDLADEDVPARPIASDANSIWRKMGDTPTVLRGLALLGMSRLNLEGYESLAAHLKSVSELDDCEQENVRDLPPGCYESAETPAALFEKLDQWGFDALVIPHGLAWGTTNPIGADFKYQMAQHNEKYQRLLEVSSGHGNSEVYRDAAVTIPGDTQCAEPTAFYTPCCWQAGEIIRQRCGFNDGSDCDDRAGLTRTKYLEAMNAVGYMNKARSVVADTHPDDWGQCDQLGNTFQPAHNYQPKQSAQYLLSLGDGDSTAQVKTKRFRPGFISASDNHSARPGIGYKEVARHYMTDSKETGVVIAASNPKADQPVEASGIPLFDDVQDAANAFQYTGGLVAVHSGARDRDAIWDALQQRHVYGTSGPRISLWFDLIDDAGEKHPMGSEVVTVVEPTFKVGASGSLKQNPGCPDYVTDALGSQRMASLCRNECFNPADTAYKIDRIEVVRVLPRSNADESPSDLIQDPWRVFSCEGQDLHCSAEFSDPEFISRGREVAYYVRAIQETTEAINGDPFRCDTDEQGACIKTNYCVGVSREENCLSPTQHRAWSSPIYVSP